MKKLILTFLDFSTLRYSIFNGINKIFLAFTQIFAIYVFTKLFSQSEVTILFLLLGYIVWFQLFELGLSQTLQNKFNSQDISISEFFSFSVVQLLIITLFSLIFYFFSFYENLFLPIDNSFTKDMIGSFSLGASILILSSNNILIHRLLLVLSKDITINLIQFIQTVFSLIGLIIFNYFQIKDLNYIIFIYFSPLVFINIISLFIIKYSLNLKFYLSLNFKNIGLFKDTFHFWLIGILSSLYVGMDYFFAAHFLENLEINAYHIYSRIFFISFIFYYAYVQYSSKNISKYKLIGQNAKIKNIAKTSIFIGFIMVTTMFLIAMLCNYIGLISFITNGIEIQNSILLLAFIYYIIRVLRDVILVIMKCVNQIKKLLIIHIIEICLVLILLSSLVPFYGLKGIFISFSLSSIIGLSYLFISKRKKIF